MKIIEQQNVTKDVPSWKIPFALTQRIKQLKFINDMAKLSIKSEKTPPLGGIIQVIEHNDRKVGSV